MNSKFDSELKEMFLIMSLGVELPVNQMELMDSLLYLSVLKIFTDSIKPLVAKYVTPEKIKEMEESKDGD